MAKQATARYGSWKSPITSDLIISETVGLNQPSIDGEAIYWIEMRPSEGGRNVIAHRTPAGATSDVNPAPFNARTRVHEYGGGDYIAHGGAVYFSNFADQQIYLQMGAEAPRPITAADGMRYADYLFDPHRNRLITVREDHSNAGSEQLNTIVSLKLSEVAQSGGQVLVSGNDFYSSPRLSPDGSRLAWLTWHHPNMPWDGSELWLGDLGPDGTLGATRCIAGGLGESIFQPEWSPDGLIYFVSDRKGWWNLYRLNAAGVAECVCEKQAEFGMPQWVFGMSSYAFVSSDQIVCNYIERGIGNLALLDTRTGDLARVDGPYTDIQYLRASPGQVVFRGGSLASPSAIVRLDLASMQFETLRLSTNVEIEEGYISQPEAVEFPTEGGLTAHGLFYAPKNRDYVAPEGERPPLLVKSHGGPTSAASAAMSLIIQYLTSRGFAVLDVNYGGSTGY
ncbi:MAG: S9 family peptidase, partial [Acidobacteriota bacterium]|nr:S9 family peptidase [Acidobacteriota bacterium]